jgi:hypothetical protein
MATRKLFIIGNGFDLHHGIPSTYSHFKTFVREHDSHLLRTVEDYLPVEENWSDLESALADMDVESIVNDLEQFMPGYGADGWSDSGHHDFQYEVSRVVEGLSTELRRRFGQWIRQLPIPARPTASQRLQTIDPAALFLTFNYTSTLRSLYGVPDPQVLHIHGSAEVPDSELILGHAWNPAERRSLNDRPDIEEMDTRLLEGHNILDGYFSRTFKPSSQLIEVNRPFFDHLSGVEEISILGHSLHEVDAPYFRRLLAVPGIASARWQLACIPDDDRNERADRLQELGVQDSSIVTCSWSDN